MIMLKKLTTTIFNGAMYEVTHQYYKTDKHGKLTVALDYNAVSRIPVFKSIELEHEKKINRLLKMCKNNLSSAIVHTYKNNIDITTVFKVCAKKLQFKAQKSRALDNHDLKTITRGFLRRISKLKRYAQLPHIQA